jgi:hypothetical protein
MGAALARTKDTGEGAAEDMNESHFLRNALLVVGGLVLAGWLAVWLIGTFIHLILYIAVGALVVGGGMYLYGRAKKSLTSGSVQRRIGRR